MRNLVKGPILLIYEPANGETFTSPLIEVKGYIKNAAFATFNGNPIFINEEGNFYEKILLSNGYNILEIKVTDKFERIKLKKLELIYNPK